MTDSVYDFLYYDSRRIASFLSQFHSYGHLTQITHAQKALRSGRKAEMTEGFVAVPTVAKAQASSTIENSKTYGEDKGATYDPTWVNVLDFMDNLQSRNLMHRNIDEAGIGQFVLCSGALSFYDLQIVEKTWKLNSVSKLIRAGVPQSKRGATTEADLLFDLMSVLPHTIQAKLSGEHEIWSTLSHLGLSMTSSDLLLAHGTSIPGRWNMIGILDARPDPLTDLNAAVDQNLGDPSEMGSKLMKLLSPITRNLLGRPVTSFAVTPLAIFREVSGPQ